MYATKQLNREDLVDISLRLLKLQINELIVNGKISEYDRKLLQYELKMEKYRGWIRLPLIVLDDYLNEKDQSQKHLKLPCSKKIQ